MKRKNVNRPRMIRVDPALAPYAEDIQARIEHYRAVRKSLLGDQEITSFANGYLYFGLHREAGGWVFREHAPAAAAIHLFGDFNGWNRTSHPLTRLDSGEWEIHIPGEDTLKHGERYLSRDHDARRREIRPHPRLRHERRAEPQDLPVRRPRAGAIRPMSGTTRSARAPCPPPC